MRTRKVLNDTAQNAEFSKKGFVKIPMLDASKVAALLSELSELRPADGFAPDGASRIGNTYHCSFLDRDFTYKQAAFDVLSRHFNAALTHCLADYKIVSANFYIKPSGKGDFPVHQNWPTLDLNETSVTIWCPLVDVDIDNGTLHVLPCSHKLVPHIEGPNSPAYFSQILPQVKNALIPITAKAGDAIIFDDSLIHGSPPNQCDTPRIAVQIACVPKETTPMFYFKDDHDRYEMVLADHHFYLGNNVEQLVVRQAEWQSLGFVKSQNRQIGAEEFTTLLDKGDTIRAKGFEMSSVPKYPAPTIAFGEKLRAVRWRVRQFVSGFLPERLKLAVRRLRGRPESTAAYTPIRDVRIGGATHDTGQVQAYYEEMTPAYLAGFGEIFQGSRPESTDELVDYLVDAIALNDGMTVLDAGCGVGGPAMAIATRRNVKVNGVTLAHAQVEAGNQLIAERNLGDRVSLRQGDFHKLAELYPAESFDRVLFLESICHAEDYSAVLRGAHQVLKPGGALYIKDFYCVDNRARPSMAAGQAADLEKLHTVYRLQLSDQASLVDLLSSLGFVIQYMRMPSYDPTYTHWAMYEHLAGLGWHPTSAEPGDIIQAVEFFCLKR